MGTWTSNNHHDGHDDGMEDGKCSHGWGMKRPSVFELLDNNGHSDMTMALMKCMATKNGMVKADGSFDIESYKSQLLSKVAGSNMEVNTKKGLDSCPTDALVKYNVRKICFYVIYFETFSTSSTLNMLRSGGSAFALLCMAALALALPGPTGYMMTSEGRSCYMALKTSKDKVHMSAMMDADIAE
ncbi:uncharacterized protein LOC108676252 [Hyalella azteca]|uniref:Uncharacterized protein LOC108676252 n=1 Tax=Hyalella azteca TaxID=294128 RepID=A0A8B7P1A2_HYAAZ|nr:uncharacterized protein LOC108676252 [Hyalella azteca]